MLNAGTLCTVCLQILHGSDHVARTALSCCNSASLAGLSLQRLEPLGVLAVADARSEQLHAHNCPDRDKFPVVRTDVHHMCHFVPSNY